MLVLFLKNYIIPDLAKIPKLKYLKILNTLSLSELYGGILMNELKDRFAPKK